MSVKHLLLALSATACSCMPGYGQTVIYPQGSNQAIRLPAVNEQNSVRPAISAQGVMLPAVNSNGILLPPVTENGVTLPLVSPASLPSGEPVNVPDIKALRYFAQNRQTARFEAELARLQKMYPGFQLPVNFNNPDIETNQVFWDLFGTGEFDELEKLLEERRRVDPYWSPDPELLRKLGFAKNRGRLFDAFTTSDYKKVIEIANANPELVSNNDPEFIWALGTALALSGDINTAIETFEYALNGNDDTEVHAVIAQKAARYMPVSDAAFVLNLTGLTQLDAASKQRIAIGFARGLVIRSNEFGVDMPENYIDQIEEFGRYADKNDRFKDLQILAWAYYLHKNYERSLYWFSALPETEEFAKPIEGIILSLKHMERFDEAREKAEKWRHLSPEIAGLYLNLSAPSLLSKKVQKLRPEFLSEFARITKNLESGEGAEALGWYAFNVNQTLTADAWFDKALAWRPTETAAFGKTLTAAQRRDKDAFDALKAQYAQEYPSIAELEYWKTYTGKKWSPSRNQTLSSSMARANEKRQYGKCVSISDKLIRLGKATANDYQVRGWCLMQLNRPSEAQQAFAKSLSSSKGLTKAVKRNSTYGYSLTALQNGDTDSALQIANSNALSAKDKRSLKIDLLAKRVVTAFRNRDYHTSIRLMNQRRQLTAEPRYMTELRGWSYFKLRKYKASLQVFKALDNILSTTKTREAVRIAGEKVHRYLELN